MFFPENEEQARLYWFQRWRSFDPSDLLVVSFGGFALVVALIKFLSYCHLV